MKVSKAIEMLLELNADDEIVVEWWDRNFIELDDDEGNCVAIPLDIWDTVANRFEFSDYTYSNMFTELEEAINDMITTKKGETK
jgi:hypothetical protein